MYEVLLISKILNDRDLSCIKKYNLNKNDFILCRDIFEFIQYNNEKYNQIPSTEIVVNEFETYKHNESVNDSYGFLCHKIKQLKLKQSLYNLIQNVLPDKYNKVEPYEVLDYLDKTIKDLKGDVIDLNYSSYNQTIDNRIEYYKNTKEQKESIIVKSPFKELNKKITISKGDYLLFNAFTNKGKSWIISHFILNIYLNQGFNILYYSPEMSTIQQSQRFDTLLTGIDNKRLKKGLLDVDEEELYFNKLEELKNNKNKLDIKTSEHLNNGLSTDIIENDLATGYDVVVIDGFNLMNHKRADNKRNSLSNTSRELRLLFIKYNVLGIVVHQVSRKDEQSNKLIDLDGDNLLSPPDLHQYSETISLIQDPTIILTFDRIKNNAQIKIVKAKEPIDIDNNTIDLYVDYNKGIIKERSLE